MFWDASLVAVRAGEPVAATVLVADEAHEGLPLLAFTTTLPAYRRQGLTHTLIVPGITALHQRGLRELHLAVLPDNPAFSLYHALGFAVAPP